MGSQLVEALGNLILKGASDAVMQAYVQEWFAWKTATGTMALIAWPAFLSLLVISIFVTAILYRGH